MSGDHNLYQKPDLLNQTCCECGQSGGFALYCVACVSKLESTQSQELSGKAEELEAEIKRLQELADYRLNLLTKMPSEWVGLTDDDIAELRRNGAHSVSDTDFRFIEAKLKEKNCA